MTSRGCPRVVAAVAVLSLSAACTTVDVAQQAGAIAAFAATQPAWVGKTKLEAELWKNTQTFYAARDHRAAWIDGDRPTSRMEDLLHQLRMADAHGLEPSVYGVQPLMAVVEASQTRFRGTRLSPETAPEFDVRLTYAYMRYAADLLGWTHRPRDVYRDWQAPPREEDLVARLTRVVAGSDVRGSLEELAPSHPQYQGLQVALADLRKVNEGARTLPARSDGPPLPEDAEERIRMNMERWRWAPRDLGERYVLVNVPAYQMQVMEGEKPVLAMRVIVGSPENSTPLFSDEMTYVVFSPYWNIPESILREETLPKVAKDPGYLQRAGIEVVPTRGRAEPLDPSEIDWSDEEVTKGLRFRQRPGPENALGLVKFIFPNNFAVYLHDTPSDTLFSRDERALSHGCIRVENPVGLARYVLGDQPDWTQERIVASMASKTEKTVRLTSPLPVHIGYWTAWIEEDGRTVTFTDDPYRIDAAHRRLLGSGAGDAAPVRPPSRGTDATTE